MLTYLIVTGISLGALGRVTGAAAYRVCLLIGAVFLVAAGLAARGGRPYARARTPLTALLRVFFVAMHNVAIVTSVGPRRQTVSLPTWTKFWLTRTGPVSEKKKKKGRGGVARLISLFILSPQERTRPAFATHSLTPASHLAHLTTPTDERAYH